MVHKVEGIIRIARDLFAQQCDWACFYREVLGVEGAVKRAFDKDEQRAEFERTTEYGEIQMMLADLRRRTKNQQETTELTRVVTIRLPESLHLALQDEAKLRSTSMNKLCISKLLQMVEQELVPTKSRSAGLNGDGEEAAADSFREETVSASSRATRARHKSEC